ncbi:hypothetical protein R9C00_08110 [Flammeovirgaceae bacterium SG7u.111]|nr:hypothetical protein [Flammeovirgaceae bacterium SG7u.132]WPO37411.1 hypothetical protein R9C00_08110 [Flammeovirgaceae bacterium SG7u.111]
MPLELFNSNLYSHCNFQVALKKIHLFKISTRFCSLENGNIQVSELINPNLYESKLHSFSIFFENRTILEYLYQNDNLQKLLSNSLCMTLLKNILSHSYLINAKELNARNELKQHLEKLHIYYTIKSGVGLWFKKRKRL